MPNYENCGWGPVSEELFYCLLLTEYWGGREARRPFWLQLLVPCRVPVGSAAAMDCGQKMPLLGGNGQLQKGKGLKKGMGQGKSRSGRRDLEIKLQLQMAVTEFWHVRTQMKKYLLFSSISFERIENNYLYSFLYTLYIHPLLYFIPHPPKFFKKCNLKYQQR